MKPCMKTELLPTNTYLNHLSVGLVSGWSFPRLCLGLQLGLKQSSGVSHSSTSTKEYFCRIGVIVTSLSAKTECRRAHLLVMISSNLGFKSSFKSKTFRNNNKQLKQRLRSEVSVFSLVGLLIDCKLWLTSTGL